MAYHFLSHRQRIQSAGRYWPLLLLVQFPEALLVFLQRYFEVRWADYPLFTFFSLYPLYCVSSAASAALTFSVIHSPAQNVREYFIQLRNHLPRLAATSLILGFVWIPALFALILPGIYVLSCYLFLPFLVVVGNSQLTLSQVFAHSKKIASLHPKICFFTATLSLFLSLCIPLGLNSLQNLLSNDWVLLTLELFLSMGLAMGLNIWTATLFLEVSQS